MLRPRLVYEWLRRCEEALASTRLIKRDERFQALLRLLLEKGAECAECGEEEFICDTAGGVPRLLPQEIACEVLGIRESEE